MLHLDRLNFRCYFVGYGRGILAAGLVVEA